MNDMRSWFGFIKRLGAWWHGRFAFGSAAARPDFWLSRWLFLRLLGCVYLAAFLSLWVQVTGLIGRRGILPVSDYLAAVWRYAGSDGYYLVPTLCWLDASDQFLNGLCGGAVLLSGLLIGGAAPGPVLLLLWAFYLSLVIAGQQFLSYQWDALLLETGFLAIFYAPWGMWPRLTRETRPSPVMCWLLRWLLFRLVFSSGVVKLLSGDETWRNLTALQYHYETQPLPTWTSWYMHQLPAWFQHISVLATFVAELMVPLLLFGSRRCRHVACLGIVGLQLLIAATGNYGFFNLLTVALCVSQLDDGFFPARWRQRWLPAAETKAPPQKRHGYGWLFTPVAGVLLLLTIAPFLANMGLLAYLPSWLVRTYRIAAAFQSVNSYGLFAIMTTKRPEIVVEGSNDGTTWLPYEFKWKPGEVNRRPPFAGPHLPRLDWQLWFAALGSYHDDPWFRHFLIRLMQGEPEVVALLERNPFPKQPPRYLRAVLYEYHFTDRAGRNEDGAWWRREFKGLYSPVFSRRIE
jgi:hypothetical protein